MPACFKITPGTPPIHRPTTLIRSLRAPLHPLPRALAALTALPYANAWAESAAEAPGVSAGAILQMLLSLALIIGLLFAGAYILRRLNGGRSFGQGGPLRVVGGLTISPRERIVLIEVGDTWLVVGVVPGQIKTLHSLPKGELPAAQNADKPFGQWLKQMGERHNENK